MNDEQYFLANAYLDGELTAEERRIAEADPEVMAEVEQLRALQAELRDVPTPSAEARAEAIATAMAEFARFSPDLPEPAPVVPFRSRPAYAKYLAAAAALVAVAGLGIVISQADLGGGDDDSAGSAEAPLSETQARQEDATETIDDGASIDTEVMAEAESAPAAAESASDATDTVEMSEQAAEGGDEEASGPEFGAEADPGNAVRVEVPADFDPDEPILDEIELAVYGSYLLDQAELGVLGPTPETVCTGNFDILDRAIYVSDGNERPVYIGVDERTGVVLALDTGTCAVLAIGSLF